MPSSEKRYFRGSVLSEITEAVSNLETLFLGHSFSDHTKFPGELGFTRRAATGRRCKGGLQGVKEEPESWPCPHPSPVSR